MNRRRATDKLDELEKRIDKYMQQSLEAERVALEKLATYPESEEPLSPVEVLKRERFRHHTRSLLLKEIKDWIHELESDKSG
jgi:hypothetical protein